jgi:uncharacterized protein involved in exopolysaccharide biosynthesis
MDNQNVNNEFDSTSIFLFLIRWWKHLLVICVTAAVLSIIFSSPLFITPLYESTVLMFPARPTSISRAEHVDFLQYGEVEDAERLLQILGSTAVRDRIVEQFDLYNHYEISEKSKSRKTTLRNIFNEQITSSRTLYGAVEIRVRDKDPQMAADIANTMADLTDSIQYEIRRSRAQLAYDVAVKRYQEVLDEVITAEDSLRGIMLSGMYHYESQSERLTQQLAIDLSKNNSRGIQVLGQELDMVSRLGGAFITQRAHLEQSSRSIFYIKRIMQEAKHDLESFIPTKFLVDEAYPAEKKIYPVRWLIVFLATFSAGFFGVISLMAYENLTRKGLFNLQK